MKRMILPVIVLSLFGITAAGAYPAPRSEQPSASDVIVEVGTKIKVHGGKHGKRTVHVTKHGKKYYYGNKHWTYRYRYRPIGWSIYGCVAAGPFWYCP